MKDGFYRKNPEVVFRRVGDEFVLVPIRQRIADLRCVFTLNEAGAFIWERLDGKTAGRDLSTALKEHFAVSPATAFADVSEFLSQLVQEGLAQQ